MSIKPSVTFAAGMAAGLVLAGGVWLGVEGVSARGVPAPVASEGAPGAQAATAPQSPGGAGGQKNTSRIVLENARVRVKEAVFYSGDKQPGMHTHDLAHVGVIIEGGAMMFRSPDGKSETMNLTTGGVGYRDANVTHEPINIGTRPVKVIEVELK